MKYSEVYRKARGVIIERGWHQGSAENPETGAVCAVGVAPKVTLLAHTRIDIPAFAESLDFLPQGDETPADFLAEAGGRLCYQSFDRPNPKTATNQTYLANIIAQGHESVFEHASATFYIEGSRTFLAELTRHRHASFSVVSQRYVDSTELGYHVPIVICKLPNGGVRDDLDGMIRGAWYEAASTYETIFATLTAQGVPKKQAREAARSVMPGMTSSPLLVSGNMRAWRDVLHKRWHVAADAEIREVAGLILTELRRIAPSTFQDFPDTPFGSN